jgi:hypothetical protein
MPGTRWFDLHIDPTPEHPFGSKGHAFSEAWRVLGNKECAGMLLMDADVSIDPIDYSAMGEAVNAEPAAVHTAPVRLWPASTQRASWIWGHWCDECKQGQQFCAQPDRFTFSFTYLPRRLLSLADKAGLKGWTFPGVDLRMAAVAKRNNIPVRVVPECHPKHMHY